MKCLRRQRLTIHVAEATSLTLLGVMKTSGPVDSDIAFATIQSSSSLHAATGTNTAELKESIKHWAIIPDVVLSLLLGECLHIVGRNLLEEVDVFVGMKLGHLMASSRLGSLWDVSGGAQDRGSIEKASTMLLSKWRTNLRISPFSDKRHNS